MNDTTIAELNLERLCLACVDIARTAASAILDVYQTEFTITEKPDDSPVTAADMAAHKIIVEGLTALTPDIPVLSEESAIPSFSRRRNWQTYWLVDPLDGTREFVKRNDNFTVNIALIHRHESIIGVINVPVTGVDYFSWRNGGSFKSEQQGIAKPVHARKLAEASNSSIVVAGSHSHGSQLQKDYIKKIGDVDTLSIGSSLKFCLLAEGKIDIYPRLSPTSEWDTAAAHCIVEQSGGYITKLDNTPLLYNTKDSLLNPFFLVYGDDSHDWAQYLSPTLTSDNKAR